MDYKYKKGQLFKKKLNVPQEILNKVYNCTLTLDEFYKYQLDDKIPTSCIIYADRKIIEKFGIEKCRSLDFDLLDYKEEIMSISSETEDINSVLYDKLKNQIEPLNYPPKMREIYKDRLCDISDDTKLDSIEYLFSRGVLTLNKIIENWDLLKNKDLSYCLRDDELTDEMLKEFMDNYEKIIPKHRNDAYYHTLINNYFILNTDEEKQKYIKNITDNVLNMSIDKYNKVVTSFSNDTYKELFRYSSVLEYLSKFNISEKLKKEIDELPKDYLFTMPIPFSQILDNKVLNFIEKYGLKNVIDFDNECDHCLSKNNCNMLYLMGDIANYFGSKIEKIYTKDEFYEEIKSIIIDVKNDPYFGDKAIDQRNIGGEFRSRYSDLYIEDEAPEELKNLFYQAMITPQLLLEHPEYTSFLKGKKLSGYLKSEYGFVKASNEENEICNIYKLFDNKDSQIDSLDFVLEYQDILPLAFNKQMIDESNIYVNDDINQIKNKLDEFLKRMIIENGMVYPKHIPKYFIEKYSSMVIDNAAPQELKEMFYNRKINSEFINNNPTFKDYLKNVDIETIFKYMPIEITDELFNHNQINIVNCFKQIFGDDALDLMFSYENYIKKAYENGNKDYFRIDALNENNNEFRFYPNFSKEEFLNMIDKMILQNYLDGNINIDEHIPNHFRNNNPTFFLDQSISSEIKDKFYNRKFTLKDFDDNPELLNVFNKTNVACGFSKDMSWIISLYANSDNIELANYKRLKIITEYYKVLNLQDVEANNLFIEYVTEYQDKINIEKMNYVYEVIKRLSQTNSSELFRVRKELATQLLELDSPLEELTKIERMFIKNNLPMVGKVYSCFEILHPNMKNEIEYFPTISPILKSSSLLGDKAIIFSDLIKASFGSNNKSVNNYLKNIEYGSNLYEGLKSGQIPINTLDEMDKKELETFRNNLATLYNNTLRAKKENEMFSPSENTLNDILELAKKLSPNGTFDYNLKDRIIRMFCGFTGINTLEMAKEYIDKQVKTADSRNREASNKDINLEQGDFIKGIGGVKYLRNILQNGSVSKEYLGSCAGRDRTPLDTDLSMIMSSTGTIDEKISATVAKDYGPIWFVLKNDDRLFTTRTEEGVTNTKNDMSKLEVFYTGIWGRDHYGIRTGFASSEINYIVMEKYDPKVGLEIAMNGFYIPVANMEGKIIFTPKDYDNLRAKMNGLSYFNEEDYSFSKNLVNEETKFIAEQIEENNRITKVKREKINEIIAKSLSELGLELKTKIDGDLTEGVVELIDTGSTGRGTNKPGDGDFDFMMKLDRSILSDAKKLNELKKTILKNLGKEYSNEITDNGDFRLKQVKLDDGNIVDIDITFTNKTDKVLYSTDMALIDRLETIKRNDPEKYPYVVANILLAKQVLKQAGAYKPNRGEVPQGGLGGVGIENWILENGGSFIDAAKNFITAAEGKSFAEFKSNYEIWDFGDNHLAERKGYYPHDNFVANNMSSDGYEKMTEALKEYINKMEMQQQMERPGIKL